MNYPTASGRSINPKKQKQNTPQAAGELTQKRLKKNELLEPPKLNYFCPPEISFTNINGKSGNKRIVA